MCEGVFKLYACMKNKRIGVEGKRKDGHPPENGDGAGGSFHGALGLA